MKILFVTDRRLNAGSIQALASYVRAGDEVGHTIAVYGCPDPSFAGVRFSTDAGAFDHVVFLFESKLRWLSGLQLARLLSRLPRRRRAIMDADGMYNQRIAVDAYDRNHPSDEQRSEWIEYYGKLADKILQPTFTPLEPEVGALPFYGYDPRGAIEGSRAKRFDLLHVGHNWWRWREMSRVLLPALERIRSRLDGIGFVGSWWDAPPRWAADLGLQDAFCADADWLRRLGIQILPPVPFSEVVGTMASARVNLMTQRPLFRRLRLLTSKYFELFCADTIPLVMIDPDHAEAVYGPAGRELALDGAIGNKLLDALARPKKYEAIVAEVRCHLAAHHSFRQRVQELVAALEC
jgi:hypothetical protein